MGDIDWFTFTMLVMIILAGLILAAVAINLRLTVYTPECKSMCSDKNYHYYDNNGDLCKCIDDEDNLKIIQMRNK